MSNEFSFLRRITHVDIFLCIQTYKVFYILPVHVNAYPVNPIWHVHYTCQYCVFCWPAHVSPGPVNPLARVRIHMSITFVFYLHTWIHLQHIPADTCTRRNLCCSYSWRTHHMCDFLLHIHQYLHTENRKSWLGRLLTCLLACLFVCLWCWRTSDSNLRFSR